MVKNTMMADIVSIPAPRPRVSVVIPTHNRADLLKEAIASVVAQTMADFELIIVNDNSTDHTDQVVSSFHDPRISLIHFNSGGVPSATRNAGARRARGEILTFLDSDDYWRPERLERCLAALTPAYEAVCHAEDFIDAKGRKLRTQIYGPESRANYHSLLLTGNCLSMSAVVLRRPLFERLGGFSEDPRVVIAEDYELWLRMAKAGARFRFIDDVLGIYRLTPSGIANDVLKSLRAALHIMAVNEAEIVDKPIGFRVRLLTRKGALIAGATRRLIKKSLLGRWT